MLFGIVVRVADRKDAQGLPFLIKERLHLLIVKCTDPYRPEPEIIGCELRVCGCGGCVDYGVLLPRSPYFLEENGALAKKTKTAGASAMNPWPNAAPASFSFMLLSFTR